MEDREKSKTTYGSPLAYLSFDIRNGNQIPNAANSTKPANTNGNNKEVDGNLEKDPVQRRRRNELPLRIWGFRPPPNFQHGLLDKAHIQT